MGSSETLALPMRQLRLNQAEQIACQLRSGLIPLAESRDLTYSQIKVKHFPCKA
jgi:hypothetical protein